MDTITTPKCAICKHQIGQTQYSDRSVFKTCLPCHKLVKHIVFLDDGIKINQSGVARAKLLGIKVKLATWFPEERVPTKRYKTFATSRRGYLPHIMKHKETITPAIKENKTPVPAYSKYSHLIENN